MRERAEMPGEVSSSESEMGRSQSRKYKSNKYADDVLSSSSDSKSQSVQWNLSTNNSDISQRELVDSGIFTSSATPSSQEQESVKDVWNPSELPEKLGLGMRRTFLNYRQKGEINDSSMLPPPVVKDNRTEVENSQGVDSVNQKENSNEKSHNLDNSASDRGASNTDHSRSSSSKTSPSPNPCDPGMCAICLSRPKTGSIIHGSTGHQVCCFRCARRLKRQRRPCPVCRRSIQKVIKNFIV